MFSLKGTVPCKWNGYFFKAIFEIKNIVIHVTFPGVSFFLS